jgi:hypothetical protein
MTPYKTLIKSWKLVEEKQINHTYIAEIDVAIFDSYEKLYADTNGEKGIRFSVPPQPFWGNIINPSVIVLFNNPNIIEVDDEYQKGLLDNIQGKERFDFLEMRNQQYRWENGDAKYWQKRFKDIRDAVNASCNGPQNYNDYIGEFEFHGYNTKTFSGFSKKHFPKGYIPTQNVLFEYIQFLIKEVKPIIIIARGKTHWLNALHLSEDDDNLIIVNNPQSAYLSKKLEGRGNIQADDFARIIHRIVKDIKKTSKDSLV